MSKNEWLEKIADSPVDRRKFVKRAGVTGLGAAAGVIGNGLAAKRPFISRTGIRVASSIAPTPHTLV